MLKLYVRVILFYSIINIFNIANSYTKIFEPIVPDKINVHISWKYLKEYSDYINKINSNPLSPIPLKYKKNFRSKVYYENNQKELLIYPANTRITGDWQDHIDPQKKISSLRINLREGNIGNIIKFRLLLNRSRDIEAEIFWSILHEILGYPVLYKKIVYVSINGLPPEKMLFEEIANKEFLERFSIRETAILENDERYFWEQKNAAYNNCSSLKKKILPKERETCIKNYLNNIEFEKNNISSWKVDNKSFLKNKTSFKIAINALLNSNKENTANNEVFVQLNSKLAFHGLTKNNLKRIFDPIYNLYIPLYYDGNVNQTEFEKFCLENTPSKYDKNMLNSLKNLYNLRTKQKLKDNLECVAKFYLSDPKYQFKLTKILNNNDFKLVRNNIKKFENQAIIQINNTFENTELCLKNLECEKIENDINVIRDSIAGDFIYVDKKNRKNYPTINWTAYQKNQKILTIIDENIKNSYDISENETLYIKLKNLNQDLSINLSGIFSKVVIFNSEIKNIKIKINYLKKINNNFHESSYDENLLTGCLTIIDSVLENISIESNHSNCEDSVNIVRSTGSINEINLKNSQFDLLDFDFSNIKIKKAFLSNSNNDCLDFSYGNYSIDEVFATNCQDKAISIGEKSNLKIKKFNGISNKLDLAVKDSSKLYIDNFSSNKSKNDNCISLYKKKQEFDGALIFINKNDLNCSLKKDLFSKVIFNAEE